MPKKVRSLRERLDDAERDIIINELRLTDGCVAGTARALKMPESTLRYAMRRHEINPEDYRPTK